MINFKGKYRPISPSFDNARKVHFDISGTELSFKFPKSDRECDDFDLVKSNTKIDIGDLNNEKNIHLICKGSWYFYGGYIFKRPLGFINIMISLFHNDRIGNLFIPENFENFNLELSTAMYGPKAGSGKIYEFPFEWTTERYNDMPWLTYKLKSNEEYNRDFTKIFSAPLEENKTLNIEFFLDASEPYKDTPGQTHEIFKSLIALSSNFHPSQH